MLPEPLNHKIFDLFMEYEEKQTIEAKLVRVLDKLEGNLQCNKENHGARYWSKARVILQAMEEHKFSGMLDEDIIYALEEVLVKISKDNIKFCEDAGLIT